MNTRKKWKYEPPWWILKLNPVCEIYPIMSFQKMRVRNKSGEMIQRRKK